MSCVKYPITVGKLKKHKFELSTGFIPKMPLPGSPEILGKHSILPFLGNLSYSSSPKIAYKTCLMVGSPKCCVKKSCLELCISVYSVVQLCTSVYSCVHMFTLV